MNPSAHIRYSCPHNPSTTKYEPSHHARSPDLASIPSTIPRWCRLDRRRNSLETLPSILNPARPRSPLTRSPLTRSRHLTRSSRHQPRINLLPCPSHLRFPITQNSFFLVLWRRRNVGGRRGGIPRMVRPRRARRNGAVLRVGSWDCCAGGSEGGERG